MPNLNRCTFMGHLGRDPEIRFTQNGSKIANLNLAVSEKWKDRSGDWQEKTEWVRISAFGYSADRAETLSKGDAVYAEGRMQTREWKAQDGTKRFTTEIKAMVIEPIGGVKAKQEKSNSEEKMEEAEGQDDIPF